MNPEQQSYPACGERRNLETRPKVTIVLDERGEPVDKPRLAESIASATERFCANCGCSYAQHTKGLSHVEYCRHCPCLEWVEPVRRLLDTTYGDDQILKANS